MDLRVAKILPFLTLRVGNVVLWTVAARLIGLTSRGWVKKGYSACTCDCEPPRLSQPQCFVRLNPCTVTCNFTEAKFHDLAFPFMALRTACIATALAGSLILAAVVISCTEFAPGIPALLPLRISCSQYYSELQRLVSSGNQRPESSLSSSFSDEQRQQGWQPRGFFELAEDLSPQSDLERAYSEHTAMNVAWHSNHPNNDPKGFPKKNKRVQREGSLLRKLRAAMAAGSAEGHSEDAAHSSWPRFLLSTNPTPPSSMSSASSSSPPSSPFSPSPPPGPQCKGKCCSNAAPVIPPGMPRMTSSWISSQLAHGAQVGRETGGVGDMWGGRQAGRETGGEGDRW